MCPRCDFTLRMRILATYNSCSVEKNTVSKTLSRSTGRSIAEEARAASANIQMNVSDRRRSWLGHIVHVDKERLVRKVLLNWVKPENESFFGDFPNLNVEKAIETARDREK